MIRMNQFLGHFKAFYRERPVLDFYLKIFWQFIHFEEI